MGLVMVVFVVQHEECVGLFYTMKVVSCEILKVIFIVPSHHLIYCWYWLTIVSCND